MRTKTFPRQPFLSFMFIVNAHSNVFFSLHSCAIYAFVKQLLGENADAVRKRNIAVTVFDVECSKQNVWKIKRNNNNKCWRMPSHTFNIGMRKMVRNDGIFYLYESE